MYSFVSHINVRLRLQKIGYFRDLLHPVSARGGVQSSNWTLILHGCPFGRCEILPTLVWSSAKWPWHIHSRTQRGEASGCALTTMRDHKCALLRELLGQRNQLLYRWWPWRRAAAKPGC